MSRKDYLNAALLIKSLDSQYNFRKSSNREKIIDAFIKFFEEDNPFFNRDTFMKDCDDS